MTSVERAYLAGFFDGEGNVGVHLQQGGPNTQPVIQIVQKDRAVLEAIRLSTGLGHVSQFRKTPGREGWIWKVHSRVDVAAFAEMLLPYAKVKRPELELIVEYCSLTTEDMERRTAIRNLLLVRKRPLTVQSPRKDPS